MNSIPEAETINNIQKKKKQRKLPEKVFYRAKDIAHIVSCSVPSIYLFTRKGLLPAPIKISPRICLWKKEDTEKLIAIIGKGENNDGK